MASDEAKGLDWQSMEFPSDRILLGQIRKRHPKLMCDLSSAGNARYLDFDLFLLVTAEVDIASRAYAHAAGVTDTTDPFFSNKMLVEDLDELYQQYGLSSGIESTRQLVRDIENAATAQVKAGGTRLR